MVHWNVILTTVTLTGITRYAGKLKHRLVSQNMQVNWNTILTTVKQTGTTRYAGKLKHNPNNCQTDWYHKVLTDWYHKVLRYTETQSKQLSNRLVSQGTHRLVPQSTQVHWNTILTTVKQTGITRYSSTLKHNPNNCKTDWHHKVLQYTETQS